MDGKFGTAAPDVPPVLPPRTAMSPPRGSGFVGVPKGFRDPPAREESPPAAGAAGGDTPGSRALAATPVTDNEPSLASVPVHATCVPDSRGAVAAPAVGQEAGIVVAKVTTFPTIVPLLI